MDLDLPQKPVFLGPATLWKRIAAFIFDLFVIDFFILSLFRDIIAKTLGENSDILSTYSMIENNPAQMQALTLVFALITLLSITYFVLSQYATGQTLGCMLMRIMVVAQVGKGKYADPTFTQCIIRNAFLIPTIPFILLWIVDPLYLLFTKKGQRLTEWLSSTMVIEQYNL